MSSGHRSPALVEIIEEEPEIDGVECAGIVLTRNIRFKAVVVAGFVVVLESCLYSAFDGTHGRIHIAVMLLCFRE